MQCFGFTLHSESEMGRPSLWSVACSHAVCFYIWLHYQNKTNTIKTNIIALAVKTSTGYPLRLQISFSCLGQQSQSKAGAMWSQRCNVDFIQLTYNCEYVAFFIQATRCLSALQHATHMIHHKITLFFTFTFYSVYADILCFCLCWESCHDTGGASLWSDALTSH